MVTPNRVIVVAPTKAAARNFYEAFFVKIVTDLEKAKGEQIFRAAEIWRQTGKGFGLVAPTGTGKTLLLPKIARILLGEDLKVGIVSSEDAYTNYTDSCNVIVITTGVALNWLKTQFIKEGDFIYIDEIHQTADDLEMAEALAEYDGISVSWASATVDPTIFNDYFGTSLIRFDVFDPAKKAQVETYPFDDFDTRIFEFAREIYAKKRAGIIFLDHRGECQRLAEALQNQIPELRVEFYHGGVSAECLEDYLKGVEAPFLMIMTRAGQSSLNLVKLDSNGNTVPIDTVIILDQAFEEVAISGIKVTKNQPLANNDLLQMIGRVHGRSTEGRVIFFTDRPDFNLANLKPTAPAFKLAGDLERVALLCARVGLSPVASEGQRPLKLIAPIDLYAYQKVHDHLVRRGIIGRGNLLTEYGQRVEDLPVSAAWAELIIHAQDSGDEDLLYIVALSASINSIYRLVFSFEQENRLNNFRIPGSDHLTAYDLVSHAISEFAEIEENYGDLDYYWNEEFFDWARESGFSIRSIMEAATLFRSIMQRLDVELITDLPIIKGHSKRQQAFFDLLAKVQSLDIVYRDVDTTNFRIFVPNHSSARGGVRMGTIRYFESKEKFRCASMESTLIPLEIAKKYSLVDKIPLGGNRFRVEHRFGGHLISSEYEGDPPQTYPEFGRNGRYRDSRRIAGRAPMNTHRRRW